MKKQYKVLLLFMICVLLCTGCFKASNVEIVSQSIGIKIPESIKIAYEDSHGGFLGDGETVAVIEFDESTGEEIQSEILNNKDWYNLPLSENLNLIMYGGKKNNINYGLNLAEKLDMPVIENGFYFFFNRHSDRISRKDDSNIFDQHSFNFTIAVYDIDTQTLYYLEFDT